MCRAGREQAFPANAANDRIDDLGIDIIKNPLISISNNMNTLICLLLTKDAIVVAMLSSIYVWLPASHIILHISDKTRATSRQSTSLTISCPEIQVLI